MRIMKKKGKCEMPECKDYCTMYRTFCNNCTSWWYRMQMRTPEELVKYLKRYDRMSYRIAYWRSRKGKKAA